MKKKASLINLIQKNVLRGVLKTDLCAAVKHKIILSWS